MGNGMDDSQIVIEYTALQVSGGFVGATRRPGKSWNWENVRTLDQDVAMALAQRAANDEAAHYVGEWHVTVTEVGPC